LILLGNRSVVGVDWGAWSIAAPDENRGLVDEVRRVGRLGALHPAEATTIRSRAPPRRWRRSELAD